MVRKLTLPVLMAGLLLSGGLRAQYSSNTCEGLGSAHTYTVGTSCNLLSFTKPSHYTATHPADGCGGGYETEAWGRFVATHTNTFLRFSTAKGNAVLHVYTGTCGALSQIACVNDYAGGTTGEEEKVILTTVVGRTYIVRLQYVGGDNSITGKLCLVRFDPPANDNCAAAPAIGGGVTAFSTYGATGTDITSCAADDSKDVWFRYVSTCTGTATVSTCGTADFNSALAIFSACGGTQIACNANGSGCAGGLSKVSFSTVNGTTYLVRVSGEDHGMGAGTLDISCEVTADFCSGASVIQNGVTAYRTTAATGTDLTSCGLNDKLDIWMKYTATCYGEVTVSNCGTAGFNTTIAAFSACGGTEIVCNDDAPGCGEASSITFRAQLGESFLIRVAGVGATKGFGTMITSCNRIIWYSRGSGATTAPIWSRTPSGAPVAASFDNYSSMAVQGGHTITQSAASVEFREFHIASGATYTLAASNQLRLHGDVVIEGTLNTNTGNVRFIGGVKQLITRSGVGSFYDLTQENPNGVMLDSDIDIRGTLQLDRGIFETNGRKVRLVSDANGTGRLGPVPAGASFMGDLTVERFVPAGATNWRLIGSQVAGRTINDWRDNFYTTGFPGSHSPNFSSPVGSGIRWPSVRWYKESDPGPNMNDGLIGATSITQALTPGQGFAVWCGTGFSTTTAFKIDVTGPPNVATSAITLPMSYTNTGKPAADGWNLVSNPLPSPIRFDQIVRGANVAPYITYYDPRTGNNATWDVSLGAGTNGGTNVIQSGQAFWLKANGPAVTTKVSESAKVQGNGGGFFGGSEVINNRILRLRIGSTMNQFSDETLLVFNQGEPGMDENDVPKFVFAHPQAPQIASHADGTILLAINSYGPYTTEISIPVAVNVAMNGTYTITATGLEQLGLTCIRLEDMLTGSITVLEEGSTYSFNALTSANASATSNTRFMLRASAPMPLLIEDAACNGRDDGMASVDVPEGPVTITWMDHDEEVLLTQSNVSAGISSITGLAEGQYMVQVSGNTGCGELYTMFRVEQPSAMELEGSSVTPATCPLSEDGSIDVLVLGGTAPYGFMWSNGAEGEHVEVPAGTYTVQITDANNCALPEQEFVVDAGDAPEVGISVDNSSVMVNDEVIFYSAASPSIAHLWDLGDGNSSTDVEPVHAYALPGGYFVTLTVDDGSCTNTTSIQLTVETSTSLPTIVGHSLNAYVSGDQFVIDQSFDNDEPTLVRILSTRGQLQQEYRFSGRTNRITLPTAELANGIWLVRVSNGTRARTFSLPVMR